MEVAISVNFGARIVFSSFGAIWFEYGEREGKNLTEVQANRGEIGRFESFKLGYPPIASKAVGLATYRKKFNHVRVIL